MQWHSTWVWPDVPVFQKKENSVISGLLSFLVGDIELNEPVFYSEIIAVTDELHRETLRLWMGYFGKSPLDTVDLLLKRDAHKKFFVEQHGLTISEKMTMVGWSRQIQNTVRKVEFKSRAFKHPLGLTDQPSEAEGKISKSVLVEKNSVEEEGLAGDGIEWRIAPLEDTAESGYVGKVYAENEMKLLGRVSYKPVNINNNYHKGHLYYPVLTVRQEPILVGEKYALNECLEAVVVRSDRMVLNIEESDRPDGTVGEKILRLSDGTLIQKRPTSNGHSSWEWDSIQNFLTKQYEPKSLVDLLDSIHKHLFSRIWLPEDSDYWMLSVAVVVTYTQAIFDSVPLFLLTGPAGSGKSELSGSMAEISANSVMIGQTSAPTMMRLIDESGGLVVIDDLESVGVSKKNGKNENVSDIAQALKVSYKKSSATRVVTNTKTMRTEILNFYGVKIISNTRSVDSILGSRMLHIYTKHMPDGTFESFRLRERVSPEIVRELRNQLHIWAFENVSQIRATYLEMYSDKTNRDDEIAAPLRVIAHLAGRREIIDSIELSLSLQASRKSDPYSPEDLVKEALEVLVLSGYRSLTITHLMLEMRRMAEPNLGIDIEGEIPVWNKPEWLGRHLRSIGVIEAGSKEIRKRVKGSNLRVINLNQSFISSVLIKHKRSFTSIKAVTEFCDKCESCAFSEIGCEIKSQHSN